MKWPNMMVVLAVALAGCIGPESLPQLEAEEKALRAEIAQARQEGEAHAKGTVVHDLIALRIAIREQTLAMLEQRRAMQSWRAKLSYTVDGRSWAPLPDLERRMAEVEMRLQETRRARESDLAQAREAPEAVRSLYVMSAATRAVLIAQYEYRLAGDRHGFPAYYVPFQMPASGASPPQVIDVPAGRSAIVH